MFGEFLSGERLGFHREQAREKPDAPYPGPRGIVKLPTLHWDLLAAIGAGLLAGYLLWGRTPPDPAIQAAIDRATRAEELAAQNTKIAAHWIGVAHAADHRADSLASVGAGRRQEARTHVERADTAVARGDTATGLQELRQAVSSCLAGAVADSLALVACRASGAAKDSAIAAQSVALDSLRAANRGSVGVLRRVREKPWSLGPTYGASGGWGLELGRDVDLLLPMRVVVGGAGEGEVRLGVLLRF